MNKKINDVLMTLFDRPNELRIVRTLLLTADQSRPELACQLGLSLSSTTGIVDGLIKKGYVIETGLKKMDSGRSSTTLDVVKSRFVSIGIGISKYRISVEAIDLEGKPVFAAYDDLDKSGWEPNFSRIKNHVAEFLRESQGRDYHVLGIGIARPGFVQFEKRDLPFVPEMFEWDDEKVQATFEHAFNYGVEISSTSTAALSGEVYFGCGKGYESSLLVNISTTDISVAMIRNNIIDRRMDSNSKVFGRRIMGTTIEADASIHECTLNRYVCKSSIEKYYAQLMGNDDEIGYSTICEQSLIGNHMAVQAISKAASLAGLAISDLICSLFPDNCIISGSIVDDSTIYRDIAIAVARNRVQSISNHPLVFSLTELKGNSTMEAEVATNFSLGKGSATLVFENFYLERGRI